MTEKASAHGVADFEEEIKRWQPIAEEQCEHVSEQNHVLFFHMCDSSDDDGWEKHSYCEECADWKMRCAFCAGWWFRNFRVFVDGIDKTSRYNLQNYPVEQEEK